MAAEETTTLGGILLECGFEDLGDAIYRGYAPGAGDEDLHPVFVSLAEAESISMMSPFGAASEVHSDDLTQARDPSDGYEVTFVGDHSVAFTRKVPSQAALENPVALVDAAVATAQYAAAVQVRVEGRRDAAQSLIARVNSLIDPDNWHAVDSGQVSVESFLADAEALLARFPNHGMWNAITGAASRASLWCWANGNEERSLTGTPWSRVANELEAYGKVHAWELSTED